MEEIKKSRHITIVDYLEQLQLEYISAKIRYTISRKEVDKTYWQTVMFHKECKIKDIANRNVIQHCFTNKELYNKLFNTIVVYGFPKLQYRDFYQKQRLQQKDFKNYFSKGSIFKYKEIELEKSIKYDGFCEISKFNIEKKEATIILTNTDKFAGTICNNVNIDNICRVF